MEIIEKFIMPKDRDALSCEDALLINEHFIGVMDGATSKDKSLWDGRTRGRIAAEIIAEAVGSFHASIAIKEALDTVTAQIKAYYIQKGMYEEARRNPVIRITASMALYSRFFNEIWLVGDCQALINNRRVKNLKKVDAVTANARALFLQSELCSGKTKDELLEHDSGRDYIRPLLERQALFQNAGIDSDFSYGAVDGFPIDTRSVKRIKCVGQGNRIVLATDGYPLLFDTLYETEAYLQKLIEADPLCIYKNIATKGVYKGNISYDDRTYVKFIGD